ncbi:hypothetical protein QMZ22_06125 [Enterococcus faecalis]|uniref:hypothetical protein n=1 Tax=Enterococcus faecalis TaxID=1351 RepID=UPI003DA04809
MKKIISFGVTVATLLLMTACSSGDSATKNSSSIEKEVKSTESSSMAKENSSTIPDYPSTEWNFTKIDIAKLQETESSESVKLLVDTSVSGLSKYFSTTNSNASVSAEEISGLYKVTVNNTELATEADATQFKKNMEALMAVTPANSKIQLYTFMYAVSGGDTKTVMYTLNSDGTLNKDEV